MNIKKKLSVTDGPTRTNNRKKLRFKNIGGLINTFTPFFIGHSFTHES